MSNEPGAVRIDALTGNNVVVSPNRQVRPNLPSTGCPFCPGGLEAPEPYLVKSIPNRWPAMPDSRCEVVLYSDQHDQNLGTIDEPHMMHLIELWASRTRELGQRDDVGYVLIFENRGDQVGATIPHPHGQLYAYEHVPPVAVAELSLAAEGCTLCAPASPEHLVGAEGGWQIATAALPVWPYELTISPLAHHGDLAAAREQWPGLARSLGTAVRALDSLFASPMPYMMWIHQRPTDGGRWEQAHLHLHIAPAQRNATALRFVAAAEWGAGVYFNPVSAEQAALELRAVAGSPR